MLYKQYSSKDGGTHLAGFRGSLTRVLKSFIKKENAKKTPTDLLGEDVREGFDGNYFSKSARSKVFITNKRKISLIRG